MQINNKFQVINQYYATGLFPHPLKTGFLFSGDKGKDQWHETSKRLSKSTYIYRLPFFMKLI